MYHEFFAHFPQTNTSHHTFFFLQGNSRHSKDKAIAAGVVGGILFFIAAIVLSVCTVKICNERKRRKAEKGESMLTVDGFLFRVQYESI